MARHNRIGRGSDQRGFAYEISYQPDWLRRIRVTRRVPGGRQSTKTLFANPARAPEQAPGTVVRTVIRSGEQDLEVDLSVRSEDGRTRALRVEWVGEGSPDRRLDRVTFTLEPFRAS